MLVKYVISFLCKDWVWAYLDIGVEGRTTKMKNEPDKWLHVMLIIHI